MVRRHLRERDGLTLRREGVEYESSLNGQMVQSVYLYLTRAPARHHKQNQAGREIGCFIATYRPRHPLILPLDPEAIGRNLEAAAAVSRGRSEAREGRRRRLVSKSRAWRARPRSCRGGAVGFDPLLFMDFRS